jgi:hypothetical protein
MVVLEEATKIHLEESFHDEASSGALVEMGFTFWVDFARAACDRLGGINFVKNWSHGKVQWMNFVMNFLPANWSF